MGEPYSLNVCNEKIPGRKTSPGLWGKKDEEMGEKSLISSWKRICLNHTQQSLPNRHLCAFSAMWVMASRADGDWQEVYPATSTTVCTSLGTQTCPGTQHSRSGCDTALLLQDGAGLWKTTLFSLLCGKGFLLKESSSGGERHWEIILHLVILPSHIWRKREIKQRRVGTHSFLRAAEIGIITTLPEPPWHWAARGNYSPPPAPCEREDTLTSSSGEASKGSDGTGGRDCGCPWKLRQEKQFLFKLLIPPHCFLTIPQPSSRSLTLVQAVPCLLPQ